MKTFRIKEGSGIDRLMEWLQQEYNAGRKPTKHIAHHEGGFEWTDVHTVWQLAEQSDNYTIGRYVETQERLLIAGLGVVGDGNKNAPAQDDNANNVPAIYVPSAPIMVQASERFIAPEWYGRMKSLVAMGKNVALAGPPGIGKSTAVEQLAADQHMPLVNISADNGLRRRDLTGYTELVNGHTRFSLAMYAAAVLNGWWVKIDEVNAAEPDALMFINSQIAPPYEINFYGRSERVHPDFRLFITFNPGLTGTKNLPESFKDRFFPIKLSFPKEAGLKELLLANGGKDISSEGLNSLIRFGLAAWQQHEMGRCRYQITPRRLFDAIVLMKEGESVKSAIKNAVLAIIDNPGEYQAVEAAMKTSLGGD